MRFNIRAIFILIAVSLTLVGCTRTENSAETSQNLTKVESPPGPAPAAVGPKSSIIEESENSKDDKAITVFKSPTCGCCSMWEAHLTKAGFKVTSKMSDDMSEVRKTLGVPDKVQSCHTAVIGGYVIEGHVPAADIQKLLKERPAILGLAAPGMPPKSPGMQPEGEKPSDYDVLSFDKDGQTSVFASY
jgi:hypothetical protein